MLALGVLTWRCGGVAARFLSKQVYGNVVFKRDKAAVFVRFFPPQFAVQKGAAASAGWSAENTTPTDRYKMLGSGFARVTVGNIRDQVDGGGVSNAGSGCYSGACAHCALKRGFWRPFE